MPAVAETCCHLISAVRRWRIGCRLGGRVHGERDRQTVWVIFAVEAGVVSTDSFGEQLLVWLKGGFG
jgi:hypothetical protein